MDPSNIKSSCGTQNKNSNPMGIVLMIDHVTWRIIQKWIPPHEIFMWETKKSHPMGIGLAIDHVTWGNMQKWIPRT